MAKRSKRKRIRRRKRRSKKRKVKKIARKTGSSNNELIFKVSSSWAKKAYVDSKA